MAVIKLSTIIHAPVERVFDLARSIDAHQETVSATFERAVDGVTSGLIDLGDEVTWEARHFGITQRLTVRITQLESPTFFQDVMVKGAFAMMRHDHRFRTNAEGTVMEDLFEFRAPFGALGRIVEIAFLTGYMKRFLVKRNAALKELAESDRWKEYLKVKHA